MTSAVVDGIAPLDDLDEIADRLAKILGQRYQLSFFGFSLWDAKRRVFVERVSIPPGAQPVHLAIEDLDDYGFGIAIKAEAPRLVTDIEREGLREGEWRARETFGTRSYVTIPIHVRGRVAGALGFGSSQPGYFDEQDIELLKPVALVLGMKVGELGIRPPRDVGERVSVLPGPVLLAGNDERLKRRVLEVLPQKLDVRRDDSWGASARGPVPSFILFCASRLRVREAEQVMNWLRSSPGKLVVVCRKADPEVALRLRAEGGPLGLLAIEREETNPLYPSVEDSLSARLARWVFRDVVRLDWQAIGVQLTGADERFLRIAEAFERRPFRNWTVKALAEATAMSVSTLARVVKAATGRTSLGLIRDVRFQRVDLFYRSGEIPAYQIYPLFDFSSAEWMGKWHRRYRRRALEGTVSLARRDHRRSRCAQAPTGTQYTLSLQPERLARSGGMLTRLGGCAEPSRGYNE